MAFVTLLKECKVFETRVWSDRIDVIRKSIHAFEAFWREEKTSGTSSARVSIAFLKRYVDRIAACLQELQSAYKHETNRKPLQEGYKYNTQFWTVVGRGVWIMKNYSDERLVSSGGGLRPPRSNHKAVMKNPGILNKLVGSQAQAGLQWKQLQDEIPWDRIWGSLHKEVHHEIQRVGDCTHSAFASAPPPPPVASPSPPPSSRKRKKKSK